MPPSSPALCALAPFPNFLPNLARSRNPLPNLAPPVPKSRAASKSQRPAAHCSHLQLSSRPPNPPAIFTPSGSPAAPRDPSVHTTAGRPMSHQPDDDDAVRDEANTTDAHEAETMDPADLYTLDEILAEDDLLNSFAEEIVVNLQSDLEAFQAETSRRSGPRRYVNRPREEFHQHLVRDYFAENPLYCANTFRRRFRMTRNLFLRIVGALGEWSPFFTSRVDALNRDGLSPLQKCTAAIRQLAYGSPADLLDEYLKIGESTTMKCLKLFVEGVIEKFGEEYLRRPKPEDVERLLQIGESRGFPGMLGSLDCMHWHWEKCPVAWKGQFTRGDQGVPTLILEAVASQDLRIWHAYFGVPGSNNDINVLNYSSLFTQQLRGEAPQVHYSVNGNQYNYGYYLVDGIYPEWAVFVKSISLPQTEKHKLFAKHQEGARKDVERGFGVLQGRFRILGQPARLYDRGDLQNIMLACIILHNMIVEDEKEMAAIPLDLNEPGSTSAVLSPVFTRGNIPEFGEVLQRDSAIRARPTHVQLKRDLVEHIWQKFGAN